MGFSIEKIDESEISVQSQKLVIRKTSLNQFIPVGMHLSEIGDLKKAMVLQNHNVLPFLTKLTVNTTRLKISEYQPFFNYVIMFGIDAKMNEISVDCFKEIDCKYFCP